MSQPLVLIAFVMLALILSDETAVGTSLVLVKKIFCSLGHSGCHIITVESKYRREVSKIAVDYLAVKHQLPVNAP